MTASGATKTQCCEIIIIMYQYDYNKGEGGVHSCGQKEIFQNELNNKSIKVPGGKQYITTLDGFISLVIKNPAYRT